MHIYFKLSPHLLPVLTSASRMSPFPTPIFKLGQKQQGQRCCTTHLPLPVQADVHGIGLYRPWRHQQLLCLSGRTSSDLQQKGVYLHWSDSRCFQVLLRKLPYRVFSLPYSRFSFFLALQLLVQRFRRAKWTNWLNLFLNPLKTWDINHSEHKTPFLPVLPMPVTQRSRFKLLLRNYY